MRGLPSRGGALLLWWARVGRRPAPDGPRICLQFGSMIEVQVLINPHLVDYDAVILLVSALVLVDHARTSPGLRVLLAALYVLSWTYALLVQPMLDHAPILLPLAESAVVLVVFGMLVAAERRLRPIDEVDLAPDRRQFACNRPRFSSANRIKRDAGRSFCE